MLKKILFASVLLMPVTVIAQNKADRKTLANLQKHTQYLDSVQNTKKIYQYILSRFQSEGLTPQGTQDYLQAFTFDEGKAIDSATFLKINETSLQPGVDYLPMAYSAQKDVSGTPLISVQEPGNIWILNINDLVQGNKDNPQFDLQKELYQKATGAAANKAMAVLFYGNHAIDSLQFNAQDNRKQLSIPVACIKQSAARKYFSDETGTADVKMSLRFSRKKTTAYNVIGYINNNAPSTVILSTCYNTPGSAGSTAMFIELARMLKQSHYQHHNYLFIAFGNISSQLSGAEYYSEHPTASLGNTAYMINVGTTTQSNMETLSLQVSGMESSPGWKPALSKLKAKSLSIHFNPGDISDILSLFYDKNIPALSILSSQDTGVNYTTGLSLVNFIYDLVGKLDKNEKITLTGIRKQEE